MRLALEDVALAMLGHLGFIAEAAARPAARAHRQRPVRRLRPRLRLRRRRARDGRRADRQAVALAVQGDRPRRGDGRTGRAHSDSTWRRKATASSRAAQIADARRAVDRGAHPRGRSPKRSMRTACAGAATRRLRSWCNPTRPARRPIRCSATSSSPASAAALAPGLPLSFSAFERAPPQPAPRLGQHTEQVLSELLGIDSAAFGRLVERGIVQQAAA